MITGFFSLTEPYVEAHIEIPALGCSGSIQFLLDTGADLTAIMPRDGRSLGIDYRRITKWKHRIFGVSGSIKATKRRARIRFTEDNGTTREYSLLVDILPNVRRLKDVPSVLGQDILSRWRTVHSPSERQLHATVLEADLTIQV